MVMINVYVFAAILQLLLILGVLSGLLVWRGRRVRHQLVDAGTRVKTLEQQGDISHYFTTEVKLTEGHLAALGGDDGADAHLWLRLRLDYLALEKEFATDLGRDDLFWPRLQQRMEPLVDAYCRLPPTTAVKIEPEQADAQIGLLVGEQAGLLRELKKLVSQTCDDPERVAEFNERIDRMGRISGELTVCSGMLEEENSFLREQVATLVR